MEVIIMSSHLKTVKVNNPPSTHGGIVWHRLHSEREDICGALLNESTRTQAPKQGANWHHELLQARLRKVDNALDRLMSGSYGNCSKCGRWIEDTKLNFDPAMEFCFDCWNQMQTRH